MKTDREGERLSRARRYSRHKGYIMANKQWIRWHVTGINKTCMVYMMINKLIRVVMDRHSSSKPRWHPRRLAAIRVMSLCSHLAQWVLLFRSFASRIKTSSPATPAPTDRPPRSVEGTLRTEARADETGIQPHVSLGPLVPGHTSVGFLKTSSPV